MTDISTNTDAPASSAPPRSNDTPDVVRIDGAIDRGNDTDNIAEATRQLRKQREWEGGLHGDAPPDLGTLEEPTVAQQNAGIIERRIQPDYQPARTAQTGLREITQALSDQHWLERPEAVTARELFGMTPEQQLSARESEELRKQVEYTPEEWAHYQRTGEIKAQKPFLVNERGIREPIKDHERILQDATTRDVFRNARDATREMRLGREVNEAVTRQQQAEMEAAALGLQQQAPAAEAAQPAQPVSTPQQTQPAQESQAPQVDPAVQLSQTYADALRANEHERHAASQIAAWNAAFYKAYPEATNAAAAAETQQRNPARFTAMQRDAQKTANAIDTYMRQGAAATQARRAQERQVDEQRDEQRNAQIRAAWHQYKEHHDRIAHERIPELADPQKAAVLRNDTRALLHERGFAEREITSAWNGETGVSLRDGRVQQVIADAVRWRQAQARANQVTKAPLPPVQRPGVYRARGVDSAADIGRLERALAGASGASAIRIAQRLTQAKRSAGQL